MERSEPEQKMPDSEVPHHQQPSSGEAAVHRGRCATLISAIGTRILDSVEPFAMDMTHYNRDGSPRDADSSSESPIGLKLS